MYRPDPCRDFDLRGHGGYGRQRGLAAHRLLGGFGNTIFADHSGDEGVFKILSTDKEVHESYPENQWRPTGSFRLIDVEREAFAHNSQTGVFKQIGLVIDFLNISKAKTDTGRKFDKKYRLLGKPQNWLGCCGHWRKVRISRNDDFRGYLGLIVNKRRDDYALTK